MGSAKTFFLFYLATKGESLIQIFPANFSPSRITRRKGRTSDKGRKFQERIRGKRLTDESQDTNNSMKAKTRGRPRVEEAETVVSESDAKEWMSTGSL